MKQISIPILLLLICSPMLSLSQVERENLTSNIQFEIFYEYGTDVVILNLITSVPGGVYIYRNGEFIDFLPGSYQTYIDQGVPPGNHEYCLTDTYSQVRPDTTCHWVQVRYGFRLPFAETWDSASFESNHWTSFGWTINLSEGQPEPSAEMPWDFRTTYSAQLHSQYINVDSVFVGDIYITFSYMLDNVVSSGTEKLSLEIWDMETGTWSEPPWETDNGEGSIGWSDTTLQLDLLSTVYKIRFNATGDNSLNIVGWYVDNIHIYRVCNPPLDLEATPGSNWDEIKLEWEPPVGWPLTNSTTEPVKSNCKLGNQNGFTNRKPGENPLEDSTHFYEVYRSINYKPFEWIGTANPTDNEYIDEDLPEPPDGTYLYKVKAVYTEESDTCISEFSNEASTSIGPSGSQSFHENRYSISPNPASNKLTIQLQQHSMYQLTDLSGKVLMTGEIDSGKNAMDLSSLRDGIYLLSLWNENTSGCYKIIVKNQ